MNYNIKFNIVHCKQKKKLLKKQKNGKMNYKMKRIQKKDKK